MSSPKPEPLFIVRCTARGCDWSVTSNVAKRQGQFWRWHAAWHRSNGTNSRSSRVGGTTQKSAPATLAVSAAFSPGAGSNPLEVRTMPEHTPPVPRREVDRP